LQAVVSRLSHVYPQDEQVVVSNGHDNGFPATTGSPDANGNDLDPADRVNPVPDKDPVSALMEFSQVMRTQVVFNLISQEGPPHMPW